MGRDALQQGRQVLVGVLAVHGEGGARGGLQVAVAVADQVEFERRTGAPGQARGFFQQVGALDHAQRADDHDAQRLALAQARRLGRGQAVGRDVGVGDAADRRARHGAAYALGGVEAGGEDVAGLLQEAPVADAPGLDRLAGFGQRGRVLAAAAFALGVHLVAALPAGQGDVGAEAVEVVAGDVVAHAQLARQLPDARRVAEQVVVVHVGHPHGAQQPQQCVALVPQVEAGRPAAGKHPALRLLLDQLQQHALRAGRAQRHEAGRGGQGARQLQDVTLGAAAALVLDHQHHGPAARAGVAQPVHRQARRARRVEPQEALHLLVVARVQAAQRLHGGLLTRALAVAEADAAGVQHIGVERVQVVPAEPDGALAEIVFLAVALAKVLLVEQADRPQAVAPDVHAEAHAGGDFDALTSVDPREQRVQAGRGLPRWQRVVGAEHRVAADGGVAGERRHRAGPCPPVGGGAQAIEPVAGHFGVAVEQQHVVAVGLPHAAVDGADEAEVVLVLE